MIPMEKTALKHSQNELKIKFTTDYYPQVVLQDFSTTITDYEETLQETNENDYD